MRIAILDAFSIDQGDLDGMNSARKASSWFTRDPAERNRESGRAGRWRCSPTKSWSGRAEIEALPDLRYIGVLATGTNVVDFDACRVASIAVTNVPDIRRSVAQLVIALVLHSSKTSRYHRGETERWAEAPDYCFFLNPRVELVERTLAIVGMGSIGQGRRYCACVRDEGHRRASSG